MPNNRQYASLKQSNKEFIEALSKYVEEKEQEARAYKQLSNENAPKDEFVELFKTAIQKAKQL